MGLTVERSIEWRDKLFLRIPECDGIAIPMVETTFTESWTKPRQSPNGFREYIKGFERMPA